MEIKINYCYINFRLLEKILFCLEREGEGSLKVFVNLASPTIGQ